MDGRRRIDCHLHYYPSAMGESLYARATAIRRETGGRTAWTDLNAHLALMDAADVETGIVVQQGGLLQGLRELGGSLNENVGAYNRSLSGDLASCGGRILGAAVVDPFGGAEAVAQLDRSLSLPGMVAISVLASYKGTTLDDHIFEEIFAVARHHDAPILVHPSGVPEAWVDALRLGKAGFLRSSIGFFLDDTMAIMRMALSGTFDRYHDVRFAFCQLGGMAGLCCGRWVNAANTAELARQAGVEREAAGPTLEKSLADYLSAVWLDTHTQDRHAMRLILSEAGEDVIVLGGDHPVTAADRGVPYAMAEVEALGLPDSTVRKIERENAVRLLGQRGRSFLPGYGS